MADASSRPRHSPRRAPTRRERRVIELRHLNQWRPARIAGHLGTHVSTVHRILARYRCARLSHLDRATIAAVRRDETTTPAS